MANPLDEENQLFFFVILEQNRLPLATTTLPTDGVNLFPRQLMSDDLEK